MKIILYNGDSYIAVTQIRFAQCGEHCELIFRVSDRAGWSRIPLDCVADIIPYFFSDDFIKNQ